MGSVTSSKNKTNPNPNQFHRSSKPQSHHHSSNKSASSRNHSTVYRIATCKYHEKCPSIKNIKHKHYTIYDLNHLTQYSHPRKHCQYGLKCKYFNNVMKGSYSLPDLCHYSIYLHPISRFITSFPKNKKDDNKDDVEKAQMNDNYVSSMYNSLQMPRSGEKNGSITYKKLGIMVCDGGCGSFITRGLWKCWNFKDLIWNYKYRKFRKSKDPNYNKSPRSMANDVKQSSQYSTYKEDAEDRKDVQQCLVTMIESVLALAGESFLIQIFNLMEKTQRYLDNEDGDEIDDTKHQEMDTKTTKKRKKKRDSLLGQNKYIEAFKLELLNENNELREDEVIMNDEERHCMEFGELLLLFSNIVRSEFGLEDNLYPVLKQTKKWQCPMIYGVLIGMINDKLKLNVEKYKHGKSLNDLDHKVYTKSKKRRLKDQRKENIRKQIFIKGCRNSSRDLFQELQINNFTNVLSIPRINTGSHSRYSKHKDMDATVVTSSLPMDDSSHGDGDAYDTVSSIVAPNAPPAYRAHCVHYKEFKSCNFINYDWSSLQEVAREKLHHPRHLEMGSCLEEEELLSILLLTGTKVGLDLIESHRKYRNYCKWRVLQTNLISALLKLKSHDRTPNSNQFFHGLLRQKKDLEAQALSVNNIYLFNTFVSTTLDHRLIESSFHNKKDGALLFLDRREPVICADISWISKFPFEHEVLFAPCALTLPSPFDHNKRKNDTKHAHLSPQSKAYDNDSERSRMSSIAEISSHHHNVKPLKYKKNKKVKSGKEKREDSLAGFSLVDGRLEALSYDRDASDHLVLNRMETPLSRASQYTDISEDDTCTDIESHRNSKVNNHMNVPSVTSRASTDIDGNIIASFLYGKTTSNDLFLYLFEQFSVLRVDGKNKEKYIDEMVLQILFQSLFLFAIHHEYVTRNNGIKAKHLNKYMNDIYDFARKYSDMFICKINEENDEYKINTDRITQNQFINNAVYLHQLYEQFLENIIANEMSLKYERWDDDDIKENTEIETKVEKEPKVRIPPLDTGNGDEDIKKRMYSEEPDDESEYDDEDEDEDESDDEDEDDEYEEDEYEDDDEEYYYDDDEDSSIIIEHMEMIGAFCRDEKDLLQLWMHFTEQNWEQTMSDQEKEEARCVLMNYLQFDILVYGSLAYFVMQRNPDSALASRESLNPLIDQLRLSLLAAYDPDNNGFVTFNAFEYFGEYLVGEYGKLRGSIETTPKTLQNTNDGQPSEFVDNTENELEVKYDENDLIILHSLNDMEQNAQNIIEYLMKQINALTETLEQRENDEFIENICTEISMKTQQLLYLTKEMEIHCNSLINHDLRYKKAQLINYIDGKREEIQQDYNDLIQVDVDSD